MKLIIYFFLILHSLGPFDSILIINVLPAIVSISHFIAFFFLPESPRFLMMNGNAAKARIIMLKFKSIDHDVENEMNVWLTSNHRRSINKTIKEDLRVQDAFILFGIVTFEQLIGAISILFYFNKILALTGKHFFNRKENRKNRNETNFRIFHFLFFRYLFNFKCLIHQKKKFYFLSDTEYTPEITAILCCAIFASSILLPIFIDLTKSKIRSNLMLSGNLMAISLVVLGTYCHYQGSYGHDYTRDYRLLPLICLGIFFYSFANGPFRATQEISDLLIPKRCDFTVRCLMTSISWFLIYIMTRILPGLIDVIGVGWLFWFMAIMCMFMTIFVKLFVPNAEKAIDKHDWCDTSENTSEA